MLPNYDDLQGLRIVGLGAVEDFLEFDDREIVNQLTLLDYEIFSSIPVRKYCIFRHICSCVENAYELKRMLNNHMHIHMHHTRAH